jgi:phosphoribosylamine--glycine ligase
MAAGGYPDPYRTGDEITGLPTTELPNAKVFHAGTGRDASERLVTRGGRVLCVVGAGADVRAAQAEAYKLVRQIRWEGAQYRTDIGYRAIARLTAG